MSFIIHANGETKKLDSVENNMLYLSVPLLQDPLRRAADEVKANEQSVSLISLFNCSQQEAFQHYLTLSVFSPSVKWQSHTDGPFSWLGRRAHCISIHVVQNLIAGCSAFSGSIIPTNPCLGCKSGPLWFKESFPFSSFISQHSRHAHDFQLAYLKPQTVTPLHTCKISA